MEILIRMKKSKDLAKKNEDNASKIITKEIIFAKLKKEIKGGSIKII
jgi:hypothetical protein